MLPFSLFILTLAVGLGPAILARRESQCGLCGDRIYPDEPILEVEGDWCHQECAEDWEAEGR